MRNVPLEKTVGTVVSVPDNQIPTVELKLATREFLEIVDWEIFQYADTRKVRRPPWRWFRIQVSFIYSPIWLSMTRQQRGDFVSLLAAASQTGNMIPMEPRWLRNFGVSIKVCKKLSQLGVIRIFSLTSDHKRIKDLRRVFTGGAPDIDSEQNRTETERLKNKSSKGNDQNLVHIEGPADKAFNKLHRQRQKQQETESK